MTSCTEPDVVELKFYLKWNKTDKNNINCMTYQNIENLSKIYYTYNNLNVPLVEEKLGTGYKLFYLCWNKKKRLSADK